MYYIIDNQPIELTAEDEIDVITLRRWEKNGYKLNDDQAYTCPECNGELAGDRENHLECMECDYKIHESDL